jgi:TPR repeat protein
LYRHAGKREHADAQNNLGVMYQFGRGISQDYVQAHLWWNLAAVGGREDAIRYRDLVAAKMTPAQIAKAQKLAREWNPKK